MKQNFFQDPYAGEDSEPNNVNSDSPLRNDADRFNRNDRRQISGSSS